MTAHEQVSMHTRGNEDCVKESVHQGGYARYKGVHQTSHYLIVGVVRAIQEEGHINRGCVCQLVQSHELHRGRQLKCMEPDM